MLSHVHSRLGNLFRTHRTSPLYGLPGLLFPFFFSKSPVSFYSLLTLLLFLLVFSFTPPTVLLLHIYFLNRCPLGYLLHP
ncbi:hypothetical protein BC01_149 [Bacillus phage BC01]|nr:hypothetical protein BC01_149 [Bacillus phage BC01]